MGFYTPACESTGLCCGKDGFEMKRRFAGLLAVLLAAAMVLPYSVLAAGLTQFAKKNSYSQGQFSDVSAGDWYYDSVKTCYELGLMSGYSDKTFRPAGKITLAECIVTAARIHNIYRSGQGVFDQSGTPWYDIPVKYAISNKIIAAGDFSDYGRSATRSEMAYIFSSPLPQQELAAINTVDEVPDVPSGAPHAEDIYLLYRAGIVTGRGEEGYFDPDSDITRAEAAAIISRLVVPSERRQFTLSTQEPDVRPDGASSYSDVQAFSEGFAAVCGENGLWGYIDAGGNALTGLVYDTAYPFSEGRGVVLSRRAAGGFSLGYVDVSGQYTSLGVSIGEGQAYTGTAGCFADGYLLLTGSVPALIAENGSFFKTSAGQLCAQPGDGLILVNAAPGSQYPDYRYIGTNGAVAIELPSAADLGTGAGSAIVEAGPFHNAMAAVRIGTFSGGQLISSQWGFIDITGRIAVQGLSKKPSPFEGGVATGVRASDGAPVIVTASGSMIEVPGSTALLAPSADEGLIGCVKNGLAGFVYKTGAEAAAPRFASVQPFSGGLAAAVSNGKTGFITPDGSWAISALYDEVRPFSGGRAWGKAGGYWYLLEY